jgi:hypothetical protein
MNRVVIDSELEKKLSEANQPIEVYNRAGHSIGYFTPKTGPDARLEPPSNYEELRRRAERGSGRTWSEIRADLEKRSLGLRFSMRRKPKSN